jgi:hypothetical protein
MNLGGVSALLSQRDALGLVARERGHLDVHFSGPPPERLDSLALRRGRPLAISYPDDGKRVLYARRVPGVGAGGLPPVRDASHEWT